MFISVRTCIIFVSASELSKKNNIISRILIRLKLTTTSKLTLTSTIVSKLINKLNMGWLSVRLMVSILNFDDFER